jgi:hypothetical protein
MKRPFFFAIVTGTTRAQVCGGCRLVVPHREHRYRVARGASATVWTAVEHRAPCGLVCPRGPVIGQPEDFHRVDGCPGCVRTSGLRVLS